MGGISPFIPHQSHFGPIDGGALGLRWGMLALRRVRRGGERVGRMGGKGSEVAVGGEEGGGVPLRMVGCRSAHPIFEGLRRK